MGIGKCFSTLLWREFKICAVILLIDSSFLNPIIKKIIWCFILTFFLRYVEISPNLVRHSLLCWKTGKDPFGVLKGLFVDLVFSGAPENLA